MRKHFRRNLAVGTLVEVFPAMGIREGCITYCSGVVSRVDGGDYYIKIKTHQSRNSHPEGIECHRYLNEINTAFLNGRWVQEN